MTEHMETAPGRGWTGHRSPRSGGWILEHRYEAGPGWELRLGPWQSALDGEDCDALITDPPYSERTHQGMRFGDITTGSGNPGSRHGVKFARWSKEAAASFAAEWSHRARRWTVIMTDHLLAPVISSAQEAEGRYTFAPLPFVEPGKQPRLTGDGPASWACWIMVSRPRTREGARWRSLDGAYVLPIGQGEKKALIGAKPLWLMRSLVRDYSKPGDLVIDPFGGSATTLLAAVIEGRRALGCEMDEGTFEAAVARLRKGYTPDLFAGHDPTPQTLPGIG